LLKAIITLTRLPNTMFVVLSQLLCSFCIVLPFLRAEHLAQFLTSTQHILLAVSTGFIAAAGYMINDYFDQKIDTINKPYRVTVDKYFHRRRIMIWHITLSLIGFAIATYCAYKSKHVSLACIQLASIALLVAYSSALKRIAVWGNLSIALLTALNVLTPSLYEHRYWHPSSVQETYRNGHIGLSAIFFIATFAFLITWLREIIKDVEDIKGDLQNGCHTLPIKYGINVARKCSQALCVVLVLYGAWYVYFQLHQTGLHQYSVLYKICFATFILGPLIALLVALQNAHRSRSFKHCSRLAKIITFAGIILIIFI
jgi:4-hydroxybenzoate polyprenyltransferase